MFSNGSPEARNPTANAMHVPLPASPFNQFSPHAIRVPLTHDERVVGRGQGMQNPPMSAAASPYCTSVPTKPSRHSSVAANASVSADTNTLQWLNMMVAVMWPHADCALRKFMNEYVEKIQNRDDLAPHLRGLVITQCKLGEVAPEFGPLHVTHFTDMNGVESVEIELDFRYTGDDVHFQAKNKGISVGISKIQLKGHLVVVMKPLTDSLPVVPAMQIYFTNMPTLDWTLDGVGDLPGLQGTLKNFVMKAIKSEMVLPNRKVSFFSQNEENVDLSEAAFTRPLGMLQIRPLRAFNLPGAKWQFGEGLFESDPFVQVTVGARTVDGLFTPNTTSPEWEDVPANELRFMIYDLDQIVNVLCKNKEQGIIRVNFLSLLGEVDLRVRHILQWQNVMRPGNQVLRQARVALDLSNVGTEMLHQDDPVLHGALPEIDLEAQWLSLEKGPKVWPLADKETGYQTVCFLRIHRGDGFPAELVYHGLQPQLVIEVPGQEPVRSKLASFPKVTTMDEGAPSIGIPVYYAHVVDALLVRKIPAEEIADILQIDVHLVQQYQSVQLEYHQWVKSKMQPGGASDEWISVHWHEVHTLFIENPLEDKIRIRLEYNKQTMGTMELCLRDAIVSNNGEIPRTGFQLTPPPATRTSQLSSWFFPTCQPPAAESEMTIAERLCQIARIELSCEVYVATPGDVPPSTLRSKTRAQQARSLFGGAVNQDVPMPRKSKLESIFTGPRNSDVSTAASRAPNAPDALQSAVATLRARAKQWIGDMARGNAMNAPDGEGGLGMQYPDSPPTVHGQTHGTEPSSSSLRDSSWLQANHATWTSPR
eukprot:GEMP01004205.1.p1 GENE.GEMP01004205.1~~GEMP01004205.1.p1  ORF type:complete len:819 (+),score=171.73 GEMP01004205.1:106-2562(+)